MITVANISLDNSLTTELLATKRLFTILSDQVKAASYFDTDLYNQLITFTDAYINYHKLDPKEVTTFYLSYIKAYNKDARLFDETGKYPLELDSERGEPSRKAYSIILLLSTVLTAHRFRIMQLIKAKTLTSDSGLFIGCGPGVEIELVRSMIENLKAYDLTLDPFLADHFVEAVDFRNEYFDGSGTATYEQIYLIELLEHLCDPFALLADCKKVLAKGGQLFLTTATNIPQFDHLYHFPADHKDFDARVQDMGFSVVYSEDIVHAYMTKSIGYMNKFYILTH